MRLRNRTRDDSTELAVLLARGFLRLAERSRNVAVSRAADEHVSLEVPAVPRPDESDDRTSRRAS